MTGNLSLCQIDGHAAAQGLVVKKEAFYRLALITKRNQEFSKSKMREVLDDVPKHRIAADFDHGLGLQLCFFRQARTQAACKDNYFHNGDSKTLASSGVNFVFHSSIGLKAPGTVPA